MKIIFGTRPFCRSSITTLTTLFPEINFAPSSSTNKQQIITTIRCIVIYIPTRMQSKNYGAQSHVYKNRFASINDWKSFLNIYSAATTPGKKRFTTTRLVYCTLYWRWQRCCVPARCQQVNYIQHALDFFFCFRLVGCAIWAHTHTHTYEVIWRVFAYILGHCFEQSLRKTDADGQLSVI